MWMKSTWSSYSDFTSSATSVTGPQTRDWQKAGVENSSSDGPPVEGVDQVHLVHRVGRHAGLVCSTSPPTDSLVGVCTRIARSPSRDADVVRAPTSAPARSPRAGCRAPRSRRSGTRPACGTGSRPCSRRSRRRGPRRSAGCGSDRRPRSARSAPDRGRVQSRRGPSTRTGPTLMSPIWRLPRSNRPKPKRFAAGLEQLDRRGQLGPWRMFSIRSRMLRLDGRGKPVVSSSGAAVGALPDRRPLLRFRRRRHSRGDQPRAASTKSSATSAHSGMRDALEPLAQGIGTTGPRRRLTASCPAELWLASMVRLPAANARSRRLRSSPGGVFFRPVATRPARACRAPACCAGGRRSPPPTRHTASARPDQSRSPTTTASSPTARSIARTNALAHGLAERGVREADSVGVLCRNGRGSSSRSFASSKLGADILLAEHLVLGQELEAVVERERAPAARLRRGVRRCSSSGPVAEIGTGQLVARPRGSA